MITSDQAITWIEQHVSPKRLEHTRRVARLASHLARVHGVDEHRACVAGLLHDCARDMPAAQLFERAGTCHIAITVVEERAPVLLHAPVGAELARLELGVTDPHILDAIRFHTTGRSGMSPLEKVLFIADYAEPGRDFPGVERVRALMFDHLERALSLALDQTLHFLLSRGRLLHPNTVAARNALYM